MGNSLLKVKNFENMYFFNAGEYISFMRIQTPLENLIPCKTKAPPWILKISNPPFTVQTQNHQPNPLSRRGSRSYVNIVPSIVHTSYGKQQIIKLIYSFNLPHNRSTTSHNSDRVMPLRHCCRSRWRHHFVGDFQNPAPSCGTRWGGRGVVASGGSGGFPVSCFPENWVTRRGILWGYW